MERPWRHPEHYLYLAIPSITYTSHSGCLVCLQEVLDGLLNLPLSLHLRQVFHAYSRYVVLPALHVLQTQLVYSFLLTAVSEAQ